MFVAGSGIVAHSFVYLYLLHVHKFRDQVNMDVLRMIYFAFIHPHLLYSVEIYANTYQTYLSKLVILNNKLLRILQRRSSQNSSWKTI